MGHAFSCWKSHIQSVFFVLATICCVNIASAGSRDAAIPAALQEWTDWVLHKHDYIECPMVHNRNDYDCVWVSSTDLVVEQTSTYFTVNAELFAPRWLSLPGNSEYWPNKVYLKTRNTNVALPMREQNGVPQVYLQAGKHRIDGQFTWEKIPTNLPMPLVSGIVTLKMDGNTIVNPEIDNDGQLWLRKFNRPTKSKERDSQKIQVFRLLQDDNPAILLTRVILDISGAAREIEAGEILLANFEPLSLISDLPARIEDNKNLRVQVKPGRWQIDLKARHKGPLNSVSFQANSELWPATELWAFAANRALRTVQIEGAQSVDPQQTNLPPEWAEYPAYRLQSGNELSLYEVHRGDPNPEADALTLTRAIYLDFDGDGYTVSDQILGQAKQSWRLDTSGQYQLGSASLNGQPQLITTAPDGEAKGLEIRHGDIQLHAAGRVPAVRSMHISGWQQAFDRVDAQVFLPPGWSLFASRGIDDVNHSWVSRWSLWDIFLVLIIVVAVFRLCGVLPSVLALTTLLLLYHRGEAPIFIWLNIVGVIALLSVTEGKLQLWLRRYQYLSFVVFILFFLPFAVEQIRQAIYPQLEYPHARIDYAKPRAIPSFSSSQSMEQMHEKEMRQEMMADEEVMVNAPERVRTLSKVGSEYDSFAGSKPKSISVQQEYDPNAIVQTGPGLPRWRWKSVDLRWSGPVAVGEQLSFYFVPPWLNRLGNIAAVLLSLVLGTMLFQRSALWQSVQFFPKKFMHAALPLVASVICFVPSEQSFAEVSVSSELLKELEQRLIEAPDCLPQCASIASSHIQVKENNLVVTMVVDANAHIAFPLPAWQKYWLPEKVQIQQGKSFQAAIVKMDTRGQMRVRLQEGQHTLVLKGPLRGERVELPFSLPVHNVSLTLEEWEISGVKEGFAKTGSLQLSREEKRDEQRDVLLPDPVPPFVKVTRKLVLGLEWNVLTTVTRIAPNRGVLSVKIPLLPGESPITDVNLQDNRVTVDFSPNQRHVFWRSILQKQETIQLTATENLHYTEVWEMDASPIWHVSYDGIAPIKQNNALHAPVWQPWPGESVAISIVRPAAVEGKSLTIDAVKIDHDLGARSNTTILNFNVRTSRGQDFPFNIPEDAVFESLSINGQAQPLRQLSNKIEIPLSPGEQDIQLKWRSDKGVGVFSSLPELTFADEISNIYLKIELPHDRWPLFVGGPLVGPAVLLWGILIVVAIVAFVLGRSALTPLRFHDWLLLGVGVVSTNIFTPLIIAAWFFVLGWRGKSLPKMTNSQFQFMQVMLIVFSVLALLLLLATIPAGLLSSPDMQIVGNSSSAYVLQWYQDRTQGQVPEAWVVSFPLYVYRLAMLFWSLWLAVVLLRWLKWAWLQLNAKGLWQYANAQEKAKNQASNASSDLIEE